MRLSQKFVFILWASCFFACKKEKEPAIPAPGPCEGLAVGVVPLKTNWATTDKYANWGDPPIVYGDQVIYNQNVGTYFHQLIGFNKQTGVQEWLEKVPGSFLPKYAKVQGNQMYWVDQNTHKFVSFDLDNHTFKTLWTPDSTAVYVSPEFQLIKDGVLMEVIHKYNSNLKKAVILEKIDFQNSMSTEIYRSDQTINDYIVEGFWGIQLTVNKAGDTLAVFVNTMYIPNIGDLSTILTINIKHKTIEQEITLPGVFYQDYRTLIVKDGQAWIIVNIFLTSVNIFNFNLYNGLKNWEVETTDITGMYLAGNKIIAFDNFGTYAFQANTGDKIWQNDDSLHNPILSKLSWFELNGRFFMIRNHKLVQLDLETGCILKDQAIEFALKSNEAVFMLKDPLLNVMYIELRKQMLSIEL